MQNENIAGLMDVDIFRIIDYKTHLPLESSKWF